MVTTLYLIRHGETEGADTKRYKGSIDVPLSKKGIEQIKAVSKFLFADSSIHRFTHSPLSAVYCSDLSRAIRSAEIIAEPCGLKPVITPELRERNFGVWEGMSFDEIREEYPEEFDAWANNPLKFSPMGGESTIEVRDRVIPAMNVILNENGMRDQTSKGKREGRIHDTRYTIHNSSSKTPGGHIVHRASCIIHHESNIVIVAHGGVNRVILCHFLGIPLENIFRIEQDYGCVNVIEFWDKYPVVKLINGGVMR
jgi:broad specificity phosphatase PhoE